MRSFLAGIVALLLIAASPHGQAGTGSIAGRVKLTARVRGTALPSTVYSPRSVQAHDGASAPEIKNVVVYLKNVKYAGALPLSHNEIRQEHETFLPRVLAVTRGST